jgi:hypothetical protein
MRLSDLIRKRDSRKVATAIPAIAATQPGETTETVARIATVAVANPTEAKTDILPGSQSERSPFNQEVMAMIKAGEPVRVWSSVLGEWLWWVKGAAEKEGLVTKGTEPGCIYTLGELAVISAWGGDIESRKAALKDIHVMKKNFDATVEAP